MKEELVAPCGMNCNVCAAYLAVTHDVNSSGLKLRYCKGCRQRKNPCAFIKKKCDLLLKNEIKYCYECPTFPCDRLSRLDMRYRAQFRMSEIENLHQIRDKGIRSFLESEEAKWKCRKCGGVVSCHNGLCFKCDLDELKKKKRPYQWDSKSGRQDRARP